MGFLPQKTPGKNEKVHILDIIGQGVAGLNSVLRVSWICGKSGEAAENVVVFFLHS